MYKEEGKNMNVALNFSESNIFSRGHMLKSTKEKLQRQKQRDEKIAFFENQKENLKDMKSVDLEDIERKLELFHTYEDEILAVKQEYNQTQMQHLMDEAEERAEEIEKAVEEKNPKNEEEQNEGILGIENDEILKKHVEEIEEKEQKEYDKDKLYHISVYDTVSETTVIFEGLEYGSSFDRKG